jgi:hypothetical protein
MAAVSWKRRSVVLFLFFLASALSLPTAGQTSAGEAQVLVNDGRTLEGNLGGIMPTVRLDVRSFAPSVAPDQAFDIPLSAIRQITIDFPRVVVETKDRVYIGPFSAFRGIGETLTLRHRDESVTLPTASLRAIALSGSTIHPVPHEWLGDQFLSVASIITATEPTLAEEAAGEEETGLTPSTTPTTWEELYPTIPPAETQEAFPWWLGLLILAGIVALAYFALGSSGG